MSGSSTFLSKQHTSCSSTLQLLCCVPQDVAEQLHQLLADAAPETPNPAATGSRPGPGSSNSRGTSSTQRSRYGITCHPQIPAVVLEGSGPHTVDLSTGEAGQEAGALRAGQQAPSGRWNGVCRSPYCTMM
jgi:hypothetical protein